jgi:excisionase family DNA binding protein
MSTKSASSAGELLTVRQAAEILQVSLPTVYRLMADGNLPRIEITPRCFRVKRDSVIEYIQAKTNTGGTN